MGERAVLGSGDAVYVEERGSGPAVVCIHGLGGGGHFFAGLARSLEGRRRVVALDLPGCGLSARAGRPFSIERAASAVRALVRERVGGRAVLLGHSMGTIVALQAAALDGDLARAAIFVGGLPEPLPEVRRTLLDRAARVRRQGMAGVGALSASFVFAPASLARLPVTVALYERLMETNDAESYAEAAEALAGASARAAMRELRAPSLVLTGAEDRYAPPQAAKDFARGLPAAEYRELAGCGHLPFLEDPDGFAAAVSSFLDRLDRGQAARGPASATAR